MAQSFSDGNEFLSPFLQNQCGFLVARLTERIILAAFWGKSPHFNTRD
jgi:hypothetical protein